MSDRAQLHGAEVLEAVQRAFAQFVDHSGHLLMAARQEAARALSWIQTEVQEAQRRFERAEYAVDSARHALADCEASGDDDYYPDCSFEAATLAAAVAKRREAEDHLQRTRGWLRRIESAVEQYQHAAARMKQTLDHQGQQAQTFTARKIGEVEAYLATVAAKKT